jgi:Holliday junction resolvase
MNPDADPEKSRQGKRNKDFGHRRENKVREVLESQGWFVIRATGSLGCADLVAVRKSYLKGYCITRLIEVKATASSPFSGFPPAERDRLIAVARQCGGTAWLIWWPPRGEMKWYSEDKFPYRRAKANEIG